VAVYNDKTYTYSTVENQIIEKGGDIPKLAAANSALVLVTCWPPGRDLKRMVVQANLVSVEYFVVAGFCKFDFRVINNA